MSVSTLTPLEVALNHVRDGVFSIDQEGRVWRHRNLRWNTILDPPQRAETPVGNYLTVSVWLDGRVRSIERRGEWRYGMRLPRNDTEKVAEMKALKARGWSYRAIGRKYGVWGTMVRYLVNDAPSSRSVTSGGRRHG